jgi:hypothetical protein
MVKAVLRSRMICLQLRLHIFKIADPAPALDDLFHQGCGSGSGSGLDPDSETCLDPDPDPYWESGSRGKKTKKFQWKKLTF